MAKISISNVLRSRHRFGVTTLIACVFLFLALGQIIVFNGSKNVRAVACPTLTWTAFYIPETCENQDVILDGAYLNADEVSVITDGSGSTTMCTDYMNPNCTTQRHFKSLKLINGSTISHKGLISEDMGQDSSFWGGTRSAGDTRPAPTTNGSLADNTTGTARWKQVDFIVDGEITLTNNSRINVDGRGYPGKVGSGGKGWGPGGGANANPDGNECTSGDDGCWGGGAGYGGAGYMGSGASAVGGSAYGDANISEEDNNFEWGSAGGYGSDAVAGFGGGRIRLVANTINLADNSYISANGINGSDGNNNNHGGAGSGGSIRVIIKSRYTGQVLPQIHNESKTKDINLNGSIKLVNFSSSSLSNAADPTISAYGGYSAYYPSFGSADVRMLGTAAGGRIYIEGPESSSVTVKKTLSPKSRNGALNNGFNPYALQMGDIILVKLDLGAFTGTITNIEDKYLTNGPVKCSNDTSIESPSSAPSGLVPVAGSDSIVWSNVPEGTSQLSYHCKVQ